MGWFEDSFPAFAIKASVITLLTIVVVSVLPQFTSGLRQMYEHFGAISLFLGTIFCCFYGLFLAVIGRVTFEAFADATNRMGLTPAKDDYSSF